MPMIADRTQLTYVEESTQGTTPPTPQTVVLPVRSETFDLATDMTPSQILRPDRQRTDVVRTATRVNGGFDYEFKFTDFDPFIVGVLEATTLFGANTTLMAANANIQVTITGATGTILAASGTPFTTMNVGDWIRLSNFATANNNNRLMKIVTKVSNNEVTVAGAVVLTDEVRAASLTVNAVLTAGSTKTNGSTQRFFTFQREHRDAPSGQAFHVFRGCVPETWNLSVTASDIITGSFGFQGMTKSNPSGTDLDTTPAAAAATQIMSAVDDVLFVMSSLGQASFTVGVANVLETTEWTHAVTNNLRERRILGSLGPDSHGDGKFDVTGTLKPFWDGQAELLKYLQFTDTALAIQLDDTDGNQYVIECPRVKFSAAPHPPTGENTDVILDLAWTAYMHATEAVTMRVVHFAA